MFHAEFSLTGALEESRALFHTRKRPSDQHHKMEKAEVGCWGTSWPCTIGCIIAASAAHVAWSVAAPIAARKSMRALEHDQTSPDILRLEKTQETMI